MRCVHCDATLVPGRHGKVPLETCPRGHGGLVRGPDLRKAVGLTLSLMLRNEATSRQAIRDGPACPSCRKPTGVHVLKTQRGDVELDICPDFELVWFDAGEIDSTATATAWRNPPKRGSTDKGQIVVDALVEGLLTAIFHG